jgi:hypothetical protein
VRFHADLLPYRLYPAEIFPLEVRAKGNAFGVVGWSIGNGWLTLLCPIMFSSIGEATLYVDRIIPCLTPTDPFSDIFLVPPTYCQFQWCGRFILKQTRGHSRYETKSGETVDLHVLIFFTGN